MTDWRSIAELPDEMRDGRPVLLWISWAEARNRYGTTGWEDEVVAARWFRPGGKPGPREGWVLTQSGANASDDDVNGAPTHWAEITPLPEGEWKAT